MTYTEHHKYHIIQTQPLKVIYYINKETCLIEKRITQHKQMKFYARFQYDETGMPIQYKTLCQYGDKRNEGASGNSKTHYKITWENNSPITYKDHNGNWWDKNVFQSPNIFQSKITKILSQITTHQSILLDQLDKEIEHTNNPILNPLREEITSQHSRLIQIKTNNLSIP